MPVKVIVLLSTLNTQNILNSNKIKKLRLKTKISLIPFFALIFELTAPAYGYAAPIHAAPIIKTVAHPVATSYANTCKSRLE